jgi:glucose-1-phosphate adenylyltransferase
VLPRAAAERRANAYVLRDRRTGAPGYWRDVGTVDAYWLAHMELLADEVPLSLADAQWPIYTRQQHLPPARVVQRSQRGGSLLGNVIVSPGCVVTDAVISNSVLSPGVTICSGAIVEDSVILPGAVIGSRCHITRSVIDAGIEVPADTVIGRDRAHDDARFAVTANHVCLVSRSASFASLPNSAAGVSCGAAA